MTVMSDEDPALPETTEGEAWYDTEIAPALAALAKRCHERGMSFIAAVEYQPGDRGGTYYLTDNAGTAMHMLHLCARTVPNVDGYFMNLRKWADANGVDTSGLCARALEGLTFELTWRRPMTTDTTPTADAGGSQVERAVRPRLRWKKNPRPTGLQAIGAAPQGSTLHDGETTYAWLYPNGGGWRTAQNGWYWVCRGQDFGGEHINTHKTPTDEATAKAEAAAYVRGLLKA